MAVEFRSQLPTNFPTPPTTKPNQFIFPNDLVTSGRNFFTQIQFVEYAFQYAGTPSVAQPTANPIGGMQLPIPSKLNDQSVMVWDPVSMTETGAVMGGAVGGALVGGAFGPFGSGAGAVIGGVIGATVVPSMVQGANLVSPFTGKAINPYLFMMFKQPTFKEITFSWRLAANTPEESDTIANIVDYFKFHMLPTMGAIWMDYPSVALIKLYPNDKFTFRLKPCVIMNCSVEYTAGGGPSFFKSGAPTVVDISVLFKEIQIWEKGTYGPRAA